MATDAQDRIPDNAVTDPLVAALLASTEPVARPYYEVGVLLDREDFIAETSYHRGRLARALSALHGYGTVAGLRVREPADPDDPLQPLRPNTEREIVVDPGLAIDRIGRLIELRRAQCFRVRRWFLWMLDHEPDELDEAVTGAPSDARLTLDFFVRFALCTHGRTPAFASGPFNATDFVAPAREHDSFELSWWLRPRAELEASGAALPANAATPVDEFVQELAALPNGTPAEQAARTQRRRELLAEQVLSAWPALASDPSSPRLPRLREQPRDDWWDRVWLARVTVPVDVTGAVMALADDRELAIDNLPRPLVVQPGRWTGA